MNKIFPLNDSFSVHNIDIDYKLNFRNYIVKVKNLNIQYSKEASKYLFFRVIGQKITEDFLELRVKLLYLFNLGFYIP